MVDNHYLASPSSGPYPTTACLTSNNNDPQQLQHVMIPGMVATNQEKLGNGFTNNFLVYIMTYTPFPFQDTRVRISYQTLIKAIQWMGRPRMDYLVVKRVII